MKKLVLLFLPLLLLCGCAEEPAIRETVSDTIEPVECWQSEAYDILLEIPEDVALLPENPAQSGKTYVQEDGLYEIETQVFLASDAESAIHQLSGFRAEDLEVVCLSRFSMPEYRFAWYRPSDDGGRICRADLFCDGQQCYAVTVSVSEDAARMYHQLAAEVFSTVGLFFDEGV